MRRQEADGEPVEALGHEIDPEACAVLREPQISRVRSHAPVLPPADPPRERVDEAVARRRLVAGYGAA